MRSLRKQKPGIPVSLTGVSGKEAGEAAQPWLCCPKNNAENNLIQVYEKYCG
jgi:hypothetical protein